MDDTQFWSLTDVLGGVASDVTVGRLEVALQSLILWGSSD
jgi:hypothetical protein